MVQKKPYDYRIDIWALGILLFELIQGVAPFRGDSGAEIIAAMKKPITFSSKFGTQCSIKPKKKLISSKKY